MKKIIYILLCFFVIGINNSAMAQSDSTNSSEIIVFINGAIVFADVLEITPTAVVYKRNDLPKSPKYTIDRSSVYVVIYGNRSMEMLTPLAATPKSRTGSSNPFGILKADSTLFSENLSRGRLKVGIGSVRNYSTIDASNVDITENPAALILSYSLQYNRLFHIGAQIGFHDYTYKYSNFSAYDQASIELNLNESIMSNAVFVRYDLLDMFVRPYVMGGVALNIYKRESDFKIIFADGQRGVVSTGVDKGAQVDFLARAGADISFSKRFGMYADIGTGINLIQTGIFLSFQ